MKTVTLLLALLLPLTAQANWVGGIGKSELSSKSDGISINIGAISGSIAYEVEFGNGWTFTPEYIITKGTDSDSVNFSGIDMEVDIKQLKEVLFKIQYEFITGLYIFAAPSYSSMEFEVSAKRYGVSVKGKEDENDLTLGLGYRATDKLSFDYSTVSYNNNDLHKITLRYHF